MLTFFKNKLTKLLSIFILLMVSPLIYAEPSLAQVSSNMLVPVTMFTKMLHSCCYIIGIMLLMGSITQYREHRNNASQVPLSRPILLLIFGLLLIGLPWLGHLSAAASFLTS
jgi:hypothetical protein